MHRELPIHSRLHAAFTSEPDRSNQEFSEELAAAAGFEPAHGGTKNRLPTAWKHLQSP
jgi:hypothetical protein